MADQQPFQQTRGGGSPRTLDGVYPQWQPTPLMNQDPALTHSVSRDSNSPREEWQPNAARNIQTAPSRGLKRPRAEYPEIIDPRDLYLPEGLTMPDSQEQPGRVDKPNFPNTTATHSQLPQYGLPGLIFGANFQWDFNPMSAHAANIWAQMPAYSWLDTSEGWDAMLRPETPKAVMRPESPNLTEGDLSVDSHAVRYIPRTPSIQSLNMEEYVEDDGRKYHKYHEGKYLLPNDEREQDRLDLQHTVITMLFHGELKLCPLESPKRVLDLATGSGIWAIEFAEKHPNSTVIGTDLSPIQPDSLPQNCRFWVEDSEDPWHFELPFDYIHARFVCSCYNNSKRVIQQAYDNLEPGGWLEFQDADMVLRSDDGTVDGTALARVFELFDEGAARLGRNVRVAESYKGWMTEIGFEEVTERKFKLPGNSWPRDPYAKQIGLYEAANMKDAVDSMKAALTRGLGMTEEERAALVRQAQSDVTNPDIHWYVKIYVVYGRKPYPPPTVSDIPSTVAGVGTFC